MSWQMAKIKDVANVITGKTPPREVEDNFIGNIPFVTPSELNNSIVMKTPQSISDKGLTYTKLIPTNAVMVCCIGSLGKIGVAGKNLATNQQINSVIFDEKKVYFRFGYHALTKLKPLMESLAPSTTVAIINKTKFEELEIPIPPLEEQKRIAIILDKADAIRRKRQEAIKLADEFLRAAFLDMFGDPVENTMKWDVRKLKELSAKIHSGNTPTGGSEVYVDKGIPFFRSQNVWKNKLELDDIAYLDHATHKKMAKSSLKNRDILMTKTGRINTENSSLGRAAMYLGEDDAANINGHVYLIRLKNPELNEFILYILTTKEYRDYIRSVCVGGIDKRQLNKDHLEEFPIINPPIELQKQFVKVMKIVEFKKEKAMQGLKESQALFGTLSQKAFDGTMFDNASDAK